MKGIAFEHEDPLGPAKGLVLAVPMGMILWGMLVEIWRAWP